MAHRTPVPRGGTLPISGTPGKPWSIPGPDATIGFLKGLLKWTVILAILVVVGGVILLLTSITWMTIFVVGQPRDERWAVSPAHMQKKIDPHNKSGLVWIKANPTVDLTKKPGMYFSGLIVPPHSKAWWDANTSVDLSVGSVGWFKDGGVRVLGKTYALKKEFSDYLVAHQLRYDSRSAWIESKDSPCPVYIDTYNGLRAHERVASVSVSKIEDKERMPLMCLIGRGIVDRSEAIVLNIPSDVDLHSVSVVVVQGEWDMAHFAPLKVKGKTFAATPLPLEGFKFNLHKFKSVDDPVIAQALALWDKQEVPEDIQRRAIVWGMEYANPESVNTGVVGWGGTYVQIEGQAPVVLNEPISFSGDAVVGKKLVIGANFFPTPQVGLNPGWTVWVNISARAK